MASINIKLDTSRYQAPTQEDLRAAKDYILQREEMAIALANRTDDILSDAAERIVLICYRYGVDPKKLIFSSAFNEDMMNEISDIMDEISDEIYDLIFEYATRSTNDRSILNPLLLWLASLGRGNRNLRDTLDSYLYKTMKDWEAAIAAMTYMGVKQDDAVIKIKTYLHHIYDMPEVQTVIRTRRSDFAATYIQYGGVQHGSVGISNNGSTNVVNMGKITVQMAWMRAHVQELQKDESVAGLYILRGSTFNCDMCDEHVGWHPIEEALSLLPVHPHCCCYAVPVNWKEGAQPTNDSNKPAKEGNYIIEQRRIEYQELLNDPDYNDVSYNETNGGLKATHVDHNFDKNKGWYERIVQNVGYASGHSVILGAEHQGIYQHRNNEGTWNGSLFEIAGAETATENNIRNALKHCASKPDTKIAVLFFPNGNFTTESFERGLAKYNGLKGTSQYRQFDTIYCIQGEEIIYTKKTKS